MAKELIEQVRELCKKAGVKDFIFAGGGECTYSCTTDEHIKELAKKHEELCK